MLFRDLGFTIGAATLVAAARLVGLGNMLPILVLVEVEYAVRVSRRGMYLRRTSGPVPFRERRPLLPWGAGVMAYCAVGFGLLPGRWFWFVLPLGAMAILVSKIWVSRSLLSPYRTLAPPSSPGIE